MRTGFDLKSESCHGLAFGFDRKRPCQGKQLLSTCLQTASRARSGRRFLVIGAVLILAIAAADWLIVSMEREASFAAYRPQEAISAKA